MTDELHSGFKNSRTRWKISPGIASALAAQASASPLKSATMRSPTDAGSSNASESSAAKADRSRANAARSSTAMARPARRGSMRAAGLSGDPSRLRRISNSLRGRCPHEHLVDRCGVARLHRQLRLVTIRCGRLVLLRLGLRQRFRFHHGLRQRCRLRQAQQLANLVRRVGIDGEAGTNDAARCIVDLTDQSRSEFQIVLLSSASGPAPERRDPSARAAASALHRRLLALRDASTRRNSGIRAAVT